MNKEGRNSLGQHPCVILVGATVAVSEDLDPPDILGGRGVPSSAKVGSHCCRQDVSEVGHTNTYMEPAPQHAYSGAVLRWNSEVGLNPLSAGENDQQIETIIVPSGFVQDRWGRAQ